MATVDERVIERWFERGLEAIDALTKQVSRVAWALEQVRLQKAGEATFDDRPCRSCNSQIVPAMADECFACGTSKERKKNG
jgi:hypothetical protein